MVADAAMDLFGLEELFICPWALREGVILRRLDALPAANPPGVKCLSAVSSWSPVTLSHRADLIAQFVGYRHGIRSRHIRNGPG